MAEPQPTPTASAARHEGPPREVAADPPEGAADASATAGQLDGEPELLRSVPNAPLDAAIPWIERLSTKLLGIVVVITIAAGFVFAIVESRLNAQLTQQMSNGAALFSEAIRSATRTAMMEDRRSDAYDTMLAIGQQNGVERVRMLNKEGRITFSTDGEETGRLVDKHGESCYACHAADQPLSRVPTHSRARIFPSAGHRVMGFVTPIYNERSCSTAACHHHTPGQQVLGVLDVSLSLTEVDRQIGAFRRGSIVMTAIGVLILAGFLWFFAQREVVRPVAALVQATRAVAGDRLEFEIPVRGRSELSLLAASFNDMTRSLRRSEGELRALSHDLERQVDDRTADLKRAQAQLVQSEKLSSLGRLSASIAHEINNPLAGILTFAKLIIRTLEQGAPDDARRKILIKNLHLVQRESERCSAIVRNLLDFARERPLALREVDLAGVIDEALQLISHQIQIQGVALLKQIEAVPPVLADFGQLRQAFVNIALNACEAMGKGGTLTVRVHRADLDMVELVVSDDGPGISKENLGRIFDPFFSTKEKGTGLGLSVVYGIVQRHNGQIEVKSELGQGTTFFLRLPAKKEAGPAPAAPEKAQ
ncbi:MAG TPA: ATP-binding protein [Anaeromyxobacteraceae bacterium]|nr:ATP-binding protein [Anaeromyxobacteraceae bacterium]